MAEVEFTVSVTKSDDAVKIIFAVDGKEAEPEGADERRVTVRSKQDPHDYDYWITGVPGNKASYEVKQGDVVVRSKLERTIRDGNRAYYGHGQFKEV